MTKYLLIFLVIFSCSLKSKAQIDTSFWFVAPDISAQMGDNPVTLHFQTYDQASIIIVKQPGLPPPPIINQTITLGALSIYTLDVTPYLSSVESAPVNSVSSKGIYISSKEKISVYYTIGSGNTTNKEMITLKGRCAIGTDFYAPIPNSSAVLTHTVIDGGVGFDVVATQTGVTTILITPLAASVGHARNATFSRTLSIGQTFALEDNNTVNPSQLGGSIISADRPIAVTVKGSVRTSATCPSYFTEQITPSSKLGKDYVVIKGDGTVDLAYIMAPLNGTGFTVTSSGGSTSWLINSTETYSLNINDPITYIKSDKPIYLFHLSGYGCKLSGTQLAPVYCAGSYTSAFTRLSADPLNINVCTRAGFQNNFTLTSNGTNIPVLATSFSIVPGSNGALVAARILLPSVPVGSYNELKNSADIFGLSVHNGGATAGSAYSQVSDFQISSFAYANSAPTATICGNTQFTLNGVVGGGPITGAWSLFQGYGTFSGGNSQLTNNVYTPNLLDTTNNALTIPASNRYVKFILTTTGICPNTTDTFRLHVKQPPIVSAGSSTMICGNNPTVQLNGQVYGATNQGIWSVLAPGNGTFVTPVTSFTPIYNLSLTDTALSHLSFVLTSTNNAGCNPETSTVQININKPPLVKASAINPIVRCSNNATVSLNGVISGTTTSTGIWQTAGSGLFLPNNVAISTNYIPSLSDLAFGNVKLYLESTNNGLCLPVKDSVVVVFTDPAFANAGGDVNSCINDPRAILAGVVTGTATSTGFWSGGAGTFFPSNSALSATYIGTPAEILAGSVTLTLTTSNPGICLGTTDEVRVIFQAKPFANYTVSAVCQGQYSDFKDQSVNLAGIGILKSWSWNFGDGSATSNLLNPTHIYAGTGTFNTQLIVMNSFNCPDTIVKPVMVHDLPTTDFSITRACSGSAQKINFIDKSTISAPSVILSGGNYWDFGGFGYSNAKDTSIVFPSEGLYSITHIVTSDKGCQSVISKTVNITPRPVAKFVHINNSIPGLGANVTFKDTSSYAESWSWDFGNGETSNEKYPSTFYKDNGLYVVSLTITDMFGCPNTYTSEVRVTTIVSDIIKLIPNVVTPNDDGKNDYWRLDFIEVFFPNAEIEIYNRWGVKLFRSVGYSNAWDGSYKGDPLPVGGYFYIINLHDKDNTPVIKGTVTLIK